MEKEQVELMKKPRTAMALRTHVYESAVLTELGQFGGRRLMGQICVQCQVCLVLSHVGDIDGLRTLKGFHRFFKRLRNPWHDITG
jgi:hypothetical protein